MPRTCSICTHPQRTEIDRLLVAGTEPLRNVAQRYGTSGTSLHRHKEKHLPELLAQAVEVQRERGVELMVQKQEQTAASEAIALNVMDELQQIFATSKKLLLACDEYLTDPDDPRRYDLRPRAHEIMVHYEDVEYVPVGKGVRKQVNRRKAKLSDLLDMVKGGGTERTFSIVELKGADPRQLILSAATQLRANIELLAKLVGELDERPINVFALPEWAMTRTALLQALEPYPEAAIAVGETLMALKSGE